MSAFRLLPWIVHQALAYVLGAFCVLAPFVLDFTDSIALAVFVGTGVALLGVGVLGQGRVGVAQLLPATLHVGLTYVLGFLLLVAPFLFGFADEQVPLTTSIFAGLALVVLTLLAAVPRHETTDDAPIEEPPAADQPDNSM